MAASAIACMLLLGLGLAHAEIFSSMNDVENLLYSEQGVVDVLNRYIQRQEQKLNGLKLFAKDCRKHQESLIAQPLTATNPLSMYVLTKRMREIHPLLSMVKHNEAEAAIKNITNQRRWSGAYPDEHDFVGAAQALFRLQDTYKLSAKTIADSRIPGVEPGRKMLAFECYELGRIAYLSQPPDYYHTVLWMQEAIDRLKTEVYPSVRETEVLEHLSYALYHQDNVERALFLARKVKKIDPSNTKVDENIEFYEMELQAARKDHKKVSENNLPPLKLTRPPPENPVPNFDKYEALCRGDIELSDALKAKLYCYYKRNRPFLKLAPLKAEIIHLRPKMILFRQVISEFESGMIKEIAGPYLARAQIEDQLGRQETAKYRVSKSAWLKDSEDDVIRTLSRRVEDMTDMTTKTAEELQIANYGLGGHYEPHFDFAEKDEVDAFKGLNTGNRIATVMFYLSQPKAGGSTVFPDLKLEIKASKHDCILWHNLYKNGEGDMQLRHAACPVLAGNKWVANKWLHIYGQEFLRPCGLTEHEYE